MTESDHIESDRDALEIAKKAAREKMTKDPTAANIEAFQKSREALEKFISASSKDSDEKKVIYSNRKQAIEQLQNDGYKIKKSKFYSDCKVGLCQMASDGGISDDELNRYVRRVGLQKLAQKGPDPAADALARKNEKEVERLDLQNAKLRREQEISENKYIERELVELEIATKFLALQAAIRHLLHTRMIDWIEAHGNHGLPAAIDAAEQDFNAQFNELATLDSFEVLIGEV